MCWLSRCLRRFGVGVAVVMLYSIGELGISVRLSVLVMVLSVLLSVTMTAVVLSLCLLLLYARDRWMR